MQWQQVSIYTTTGALDNVCAMLCSLNINGMEIEDSADFNDFLENSKQYWDYVDDDLMKEKTTCPTRVKIYLPDNVHGREQLVEVKTALERLKQDETINWGSLALTADNVDEADWENNWKQYFKPLPIGQNILVVPLWEKNVDTAGRLVLKIDPGMLFGTGTHQTTQLCMELLERFVTKETNLLDLGCGSGILSILGLLLGAKHAFAADIDKNAADICYQNAAENGIGQDIYTVRSGDILQDEALLDEIGYGKYDVVVANIVADVIIAALPVVKKQLAPGGVFIASGIIDIRLEEVKQALSGGGFTICEVHEKDDWAALYCRL